MELYFDIAKGTYFKLLSDEASARLTRGEDRVTVNYLLLARFLSDGGTLDINAAHFRPKAGDVALMTADDKFRISFADDEPGCRFLLVDIDDFLQNEFVHPKPSAADVRTFLANGGRIVRAQRQPNLSSAAERLFRECADERLYFEREAVCLFSLVLLELFRTKKAETDRGHALTVREYIEPVLAFIDRNFREPISTADLAGACGLSENHFRRLFVEYTGLPPNEFLARYRIDVAKELLARDDLRLEDVRLRTGFRTTTALYRNFEKYVGMTPGEFRKRVQSAPK